MGSWANSIHVRHDNPAAVTAAVQAIMVAEGYRVDTRVPAEVGAAGHGPEEPVTHLAGEDWDDRDDDEQFERDLDDEDDDSLDDEPIAPAGPQHRALKIYRPRKGWVGILDSEYGSDLAQQLSARLSADVIQLGVNDSDSWWYGLYRGGAATDQFDSMGDHGDDFEMDPPGLQEALARGDEDEVDRIMQRELLKHAPKGPIRFPFGGLGMPPEMALLRERMDRGKASLWDRIRYFWLWLKFQYQVLRGVFRRDSDMDFGFDIPRSEPLDKAALRAHLDRLRELFPAADENALTELMPKSQFPAETLLVEFLRAVGLPTLYAYLSYDYLEDHSRDELADEGIVQAAELRFVSGAF